MPDPRVVLTTLAVQDAAVLRVGERLALAAPPLCRDTGFTIGITVQRLGQYGSAYRPAAEAVLKLAEAPTVAMVAAGSAGEAAGLRAGDVLIAADGEALPVVPAKAGGGDYRGTAAALDRLDAALADGTVRLDVVRAGAPLTVTIAGKPACRARFEIRPGRSSNASSDGRTVQVSSALAADARGDGELAAILAHELAHSILRHPQRLKTREPGLSVRRTEVEADRLSVYLLDRANYLPEEAVAFWSRWGPAHDWGILSDRTHPGWRKRADAIRAEAATIAARRAAGQAVVPSPDLQP